MELWPDIRQYSIFQTQQLDIILLRLSLMKAKLVCNTFQFESVDRIIETYSKTFRVSQLLLVFFVTFTALFLKSLIFRNLCAQKRWKFGNSIPKKNLFRYENPINLMILMIQVAELMELFKQIEQQFFVAFFPDIAVKIWKCGYGVIYFLMWMI